MKKMLIPATTALLVCTTLFLTGFKPITSTITVKGIKHTVLLQNTEKPLDIVVTHVHEGKQSRMSSIHETIAGNRLTFIYHDGARIVLNFSKPIKVGQYQIHDRTSELQVIYYPAGGYPVVMLGYVTMYSLKPLSGRVFQLYDSEHTLHLSSSSIFAF